MKFDYTKLTLDEKLKLLTGKDFWQTEDFDGKAPYLLVSDGPNGLRKCSPNGDLAANAMPTLSTLGNTWNPSLAYLEAQSIASEFIEKNVDMILGPGVNIKKSPFCGRNFEYFSEDPYLSGIMGKYYIKGAKDLNVATCLKHFCCNNYEFEREFRSSEVDERTLFEIYLRPFEIALEAKPEAVMPSYNPVNGIYACENKYLLQDVLKNKFHFDGYVISDWGAVHNSAKSLKAGIDLRMAFDQRAFGELKDAYDKKIISDEEINRSLDKLFTLIEEIKTKDKKVIYDKQKRHENAIKIAEEGIVLLKNNDNLLPLDNSKKIFICGECSENPFIGGGGSSQVKPIDKMITLADDLKKKNYIIDSRFTYTYQISLGSSVLLQRIDDNDVSILTVGVSPIDFAEGYDRTTLRLTPIQEGMIHLAASRNKKIIVIVYAGGVVDMSTWINEVDAVIFAGYSGEGVNEALGNIISGEVSPSGKLAETFVYNTDYSYTDGNSATDSYIQYLDTIFVGYRGMGKRNMNILFPFGFGLSYANFEYSNLNIEKIGEDKFNVSCLVKNVSNIEAKEVVQLYVGDLSSSVSRPIKELRDFKKILLKPHEEKKVEFELNKRDFSFYNACLHDWYLENGKFLIEIGSSVVDIKLKDIVDIELDKYSQYSREV